LGTTLRRGIRRHLVHDDHAPGAAAGAS
jgi:hypothetical protein